MIADADIVENDDIVENAAEDNDRNGKRAFGRTLSNQLMIIIWMMLMVVQRRMTMVARRLRMMVMLMVMERRMRMMMMVAVVVSVKYMRAPNGSKIRHYCCCDTCHA